MNRTAKHLRKLGLNNVVQSGQSHPDNTSSGYAIQRPVEIFKGKHCDTNFGGCNHQNKRKSPWKGHGDILGRNRDKENARG